MGQKSERCIILVFRSNIPDMKTGEKVLAQLKKVEGVTCAIMDLEDWENIIRVEWAAWLPASQIECIVARVGCECTELEN